MIIRRRSRQSSKERYLAEAQTLRDEAKLLPYGPLRDAVLKEARHAEAMAHMEDWVDSPGLRPLKKDDTPGPG